ncbi:unnamed protein product [Mytilus edulis]|uniref:Endonuclease/exonuclease/phosphatase domain-containing protein n=1 Tax=Mytilus edulis TaxID=6550 RepID=A0A8S3UFG1_MYTED|nr:unnamed protein product [Mytilus edulis]
MIKLPKNKKKIIAGYYRPPGRTDDLYLTNSHKEITDLKTNNKNTIHIIGGGDFNAPDISWESNSITGSKHYPLRVSQTYLDISQDMALEQMVKFPTRLQNTLDLILTSHPSFMIRCKPLPPIGLKSDHDIVLYDTNIQPNRVKPTRRKIFLWKKANMKAIKISLKNFGEQFCQSKDQTVEAMWKAIKTILEQLIEKHVPTKQTMNRHTHPWINTQTRRAMRRKQRAHSKAKRSNNPSDWEKYKKLKANTQKETRKAHRKYIQDVVSNDFKENPKRFYTYVKSKKQESSGVSALTNTDDNTSIEYRIIERQHVMSKQNANTFISRLETALSKYKLPKAQELLLVKPTREKWKTTVKCAIQHYWAEKWEMEKSEKSTMKYINIKARQLPTATTEALTIEGFQSALANTSAPQKTTP